MFYARAARGWCMYSLLLRAGKKFIRASQLFVCCFLVYEAEINFSFFPATRGAAAFALARARK